MAAAPFLMPPAAALTAAATESSARGQTIPSVLEATLTVLKRDTEVLTNELCEEQKFSRKKIILLTFS